MRIDSTFNRSTVLVPIVPGRMIPARAIQLFPFMCADDVSILENFAYGDTPSRESVVTLLEELLGGEEEQTAVSVHALAGGHRTAPSTRGRPAFPDTSTAS